MTRESDELLTAERETARTAGRQYAVEIDLGIQWDIGAPLPFLISNGRRAAVLFHLLTSPDTEDTEDTEDTGVVVFDGARDVWFGGLNDEALKGHPLYGAGLNFYAAHEVIDSEWITESERRNSVHEFHRPGWHQRMKHYVLCFHDDTLECLAAGFRTERHAGDFADAVRAVSARLLDEL